MSTLLQLPLYQETVSVCVCVCVCDHDLYPLWFVSVSGILFPLVTHFRLFVLCRIPLLIILPFIRLICCVKICFEQLSYPIFCINFLCSYFCLFCPLFFIFLPPSFFCNLFPGLSIPLFFLPLFILSYISSPLPPLSSFSLSLPYSPPILSALSPSYLHYSHSFFLFLLSLLHVFFFLTLSLSHTLYCSSFFPFPLSFLFFPAFLSATPHLQECTPL